MCVPRAGRSGRQLAAPDSSAPLARFEDQPQLVRLLTQGFHAFHELGSELPDQQVVAGLAKLRERLAGAQPDGTGAAIGRLDQLLDPRCGVIEKAPGIDRAASLLRIPVLASRHQGAD